MENFERYGLKTNPFRITPATNPDELIWAGFKDTKKAIQDRIKRSIQTTPSTLVLNWGEYGSGKTHAARYFNKETVLKKISEGLPAPISFNICFPQSKEPTKDIYTQLIDRIDINFIRSIIEFKNEEIDNILNSITDNTFIKNLIKLILDNSVSESILKTFLYGNYKINEALIKSGVSRKLSTENDYVDFLGALFSFITYKKKFCSNIILWIDEFESIALQTSANISSVNNFIRTLIDNSPNNILIFLNLTQSAMMDREDLSEYLQSAVKSRIKTQIELRIPDPETLKDYLMELLNNKINRINNSDYNNYEPFTEEVIDIIIKDNKDVSLRQYNEIFSSLLEYAVSDKKSNIDLNYYNSIKSELIGY